jgi:predicted histone-like DNA-binding protein
MNLIYKVSPVKSHLNQGGEVKFIARPDKRQKADFRKISDIISDRSTLSSVDIIAVLEAFASLVPELLMDNYSVHLPPLGIFSLSFKSECHDTPEDVNFTSVKEVKMQFRPDKEIITKLKVAKARKAAG